MVCLVWKERPMLSVSCIIKDVTIFTSMGEFAKSATSHTQSVSVWSWHLHSHSSSLYLCLYLVYLPSMWAWNDNSLSVQTVECWLFPSIQSVKTHIPCHVISLFLTVKFFSSIDWIVQQLSSWPWPPSCSRGNLQHSYTATLCLFHSWGRWWTNHTWRRWPRSLGPGPADDVRKR